MLVKSEKQLPNGKRQVTVILDKDETLLPIAPNSFYRLGQPLDDVVASHMLEESERVSWCSVEQKWT